MMSTFILAVTGPTSSGKSHFTNLLKKIAANQGVKVTSISSDEFYNDLSHLTMDERNQINNDHPNSIDENEFILALNKISASKSVDIPIYDFSIHNRSANKRRIEPVDLLIVEGIFTLTFPEIDKFYSLRIYIDMDDDVRVIRRIQRDMEVRGRSLNSVIDQYIETVKPTQQKFVERDKDKVDMVLHGNRDHEIIMKMIIALILQNKN